MPRPAWSRRRTRARCSAPSASSCSSSRSADSCRSCSRPARWSEACTTSPGARATARRCSSRSSRRSSASLGSVKGWSDESLGLYAIMVPLTIALGYDRLVTVGGPEGRAVCRRGRRDGESVQDRDRRVEGRRFDRRPHRSAPGPARSQRRRHRRLHALVRAAGEGRPPEIAVRDRRRTTPRWRRPTPARPSL